MNAACIIALAGAAGLAFVGYFFTAFGDWATDRRTMPQMLIAFILAVGFIGLLVK